jgi:hypothetical protein
MDNVGGDKERRPEIKLLTQIYDRVKTTLSYLKGHPQFWVNVPCNENRHLGVLWHFSGQTLPILE